MVLCSEPPPQIKLPESNVTELTDDANCDSLKLEKGTRMLHGERHGSCVVTLSDLELNGSLPRHHLQTLEITKSPGGGSQISHNEPPSDTNASHRHAIADAAWEALKRLVDFRGQPIGTVAAIDKSLGAAVSKKQVLVRGFIPGALTFLMKGEHLIVKNFLVESSPLQSRENMIDLFKLEQGVTPASFKVHHRNPTQKTENLLADFGETAMGTAAVVDYGLCWILLRAYTKWNGDNFQAECPNCQRAAHLILGLCLSKGCGNSSALFGVDGCTMDRRMVSLRDFIPSALAFLIEGQQLTVKNFLVHNPFLQSRENMVDLFQLGQDVMLTSFKVHHCNSTRKTESSLTDFGETASGRVEPLGSLWWIILLCAYSKWAKANSLAVRPSYRRAMHLILRMCLPEKCDTSLALLYTDACSTTARKMVFFKDFIPSALNFLIKRAYLILKNFLVKKIEPFRFGLNVMPESLLADFVEIFVGRVSTVVSRFWWIILQATYIKWTGDSCQWAMEFTWDLCFAEGTYNPPGLLFAASFSTYPMVMDSFQEKGPNNVAVIYMDEPLNEYFASYWNAIGRLRWHCEVKGRSVDVSRIYGTKMKVFTTPPGGSFYLKLVYTGRTLTFPLYGRNLYVMGWRGPHCTVEIKARSENRSNYMSGDGVILLPTKKNYKYIAPDGEVEKVLLGPHALRQAFEVMYKYRGENRTEVCQAVATIAVNFSEAARLQNVLQDIRICFQQCSTFELGGENALWVNTYGHYSHMGMKRIDERMSGSTLTEIKNRKGADISEEQILQNIRIFLRDGYFKGKFVHEVAPKDPTEANAGWEDDADYWRSVEGTKFSNKRSRSGGYRRGNLKVPRLEEFPTGVGDGGFPTTFPPWLLEDWYPLVNVEEHDGNAEAEQSAKDKEESQWPQNGGKSSEQNVEQLTEESKLLENDEKGDDDRGDEHATSIYKITEVNPEASYVEFFNQFSAVRKMFDLNKKRQSHLQVPMRSVDRIILPTINAAVSSASQAHSNMKEGILSSARATHMAGKNLIAQRPALQQHILRAGHFFRRFMRFVP